MKLRHKSQMLIVVSTVMVTVIFAATSLLTYRSYTLESLKEQGRMAGEMIRLTVTHEMSEGSPQHKLPYIDSLSGIPTLKHAHIIPSKNVIEQMGIDTSRRDPVSDSEMQVIETGEEFQEMLFADDIRFHFTIPYVASSRGLTNCLQCHDAREGEILGAVSLEIDVTDQFYAAIRNTVGIVMLFILFAGGLAYALRRLINPVELTTRELKQVVTRAESGDFSARITKYSDDEIGDIADRTNHFMDTLENSIGSIANEIDTLMAHHQFTDHGNLLNTTVSVVNTMAKVSRFKQVIENDRTLEEVYFRFQVLLEEHFKLTRFTFYEMSNLKNRLTPVFSAGVPEDNELWCSKEITKNCEFCRAKRTAQTTSSADAPNICPSFSGCTYDGGLKHTCIPMIMSGTVGGILQLVYHDDEKAKIDADLPVIQAFMDEATPVIEAKRLMKSLKDSSMRDPLTNLYNRRFLEEYVETLTSGIQRRKSQIGVLMCDIDHFKHVNDTYGHEVGDDVLKGTCNIITETVRNADIVVRYGGEEFLVLLLDSNEEGALMVANRIRTTLEEHKFNTAQGPINKTMSSGLAMFPSDHEQFWECVKYADLALYQAKDSGRNKVVRYHQSGEVKK